MFLAGKIKSVMNAKIPNIPKATRSGYNSANSQQTNSRTSDQAKWRREAENEYNKWKQSRTNLRGPTKYPDSLLMDPLIAQNLRTLNLWPAPPSYTLFIPQLKSNYRHLAKTHHPDTLPPDADAAAKDAAAKRFQAISMAYNQLLLSVRQFEKESQGAQRDETPL
eukprot:gene44084-53895_t